MRGERGEMRVRRKRRDSTLECFFGDSGAKVSNLVRNREYTKVFHCHGLIAIAVYQILTMTIINEHSH